MGLHAKLSRIVDVFSFDVIKMSLSASTGNFNNSHILTENPNFSSSRLDGSDIIELDKNLKG